MMAAVLAKKLQIKPGDSVRLLHAPKGMNLGPLPDGADVATRFTGNVVLLFAGTREQLEERSAAALKAVRDDGILWVCYPKGGSGIKTDLKRDIVWDAMKPTGWRPVAQVAVDDVWSALRFRPDADGR